MQRCPNCGEENPDRFRLCGYCGTQLVAPVAPPEVRKTVTIVFGDLKGSTSLGERLDSESLREVLRRYFEAMRAVLERHGGTVEKYIGDAVMAVFGLPQLHEDDALRAVRAAADMRRALAELNEELERGWGLTLANRTGVNTGEVVAGDVTVGQRLVTGDAVNVAARLEQSASEMEILIGETTFRLVRDAVEVEPVEALALKGKSEPVPAYRLLSVREGEGIARRLDAPMVGRASELASLVDAFRQASAEHRAQVVTVVGQAGLGKSRLVQECLGAIADEALVLHGRCLPYGDGITFWPLAEAVKQAAAVDEDDGLEKARLKLAALLPTEGADVTERLAAAIGLSTDSFAMAETYWATRKFFEELSRRRPVVVVFDDIHWAEPTFLGLIEHIADEARDARLLLLCPARPELLEERPEWLLGRSYARRVVLEALSEGESAQIIDNLLGRSGLPDAVRAQITRAAEGNPLFVEQMLSMLMDEGALRPDQARRWATQGEVASIMVPPTISALLAARLDRLPGEEQAVIECSAVAGLVFYRAAVRELAPEALRTRVDPNLTSLRRRELIRTAQSAFTGEDAYRFQHVLIQDAAYQRLLKRARADLHEAFAGWLERMAGPRVMEYEEILGYHLEQSFRYRAELGPIDEHGRSVGARAADRLGSAGRRALARGDMPAAATLLERTSGLLGDDNPRRLELAQDLAEALMEMGEFERAEAVLAAALETAVALGDRRLEKAIGLSRLRVRYATDPEGWTDAALRDSEAAIPIFEEFGDHASLAKAWRLIATVHGTSCHYAPAEEATQRAIDHARLAGNRLLETRNFPAMALCALLGPTEVTEAIARCEGLVDQAAGDRRAEAIVLGALSQLHAMQGRFAYARDLYRRSRSTLDDLGGRLQAAATSIDSGPVEMLAGDPQAAEAELRADYEALRAMGEKFFASFVAALLGQALYAQGRYDEADALSRASEKAAALDDIPSQILWRCVRSKTLARAAHSTEATTLAEQALDLVRQTDAVVMQGQALLDLAEVLRLSSRDAEALQAVGEALELFERKGDVVSAARARGIMAELAGGGETVQPAHVPA